VIAPEIGQVTDAVANSPTAPESGCHSTTDAEHVKEGLVALTADEVGFTTTVVLVPISGNIVASTLDVAKS